MAAKLTIKKTTVDVKGRVFEVTDDRKRVVGYVAYEVKPYKTDKGKNKFPKFWACALIAAEFKGIVDYRFDKRIDAVEALVKLRSIKADTAAIKVVK